MNPTIIKEWWLASWEVKLGGIALLIAGFTAGDIAPYITILPGDAETGLESMILKYWGFIVMGIMWLLRITKTSTKLVMFQKDADSKETVAAAKAVLKETPDQAKIRLLEERLQELEGTPSPKA